MVVSRCGIFTIFAPPGHACGPQGVKMMNIAHLVVMMADSTSVTWCELANDAPGFHVKTTSTYRVGNSNISKYVPGREAAENFASKYVLAGRA